MKRQTYQPQNLAAAMERQTEAAETAKEILKRQGIIDPILLPFDDRLAQYEAMRAYQSRHSSLMHKLLNDTLKEEVAPVVKSAPSFQPYKDN